jgi:hypothetical protein
MAELRVPAANLRITRFTGTKVQILTGIWRSGRGEAAHCSNRGEDGAARLERRANAYVDVCNIMRNACRKTPAGGVTSTKNVLVY